LRQYQYQSLGGETLEGKDGLRSVPTVQLL
jgi:hypothetical protein